MYINRERNTQINKQIENHQGKEARVHNDGETSRTDVGEA